MDKTFEFTGNNRLTTLTVSTKGLTLKRGEVALTADWDSIMTIEATRRKRKANARHTLHIYTKTGLFCTIDGAEIDDAPGMFQAIRRHHRITLSPRHTRPNIQYAVTLGIIAAVGTLSTILTLLKKKQPRTTGK